MPCNLKCAGSSHLFCGDGFTSGLSEKTGVNAGEGWTSCFASSLTELLPLLVCGHSCSASMANLTGRSSPLLAASQAQHKDTCCWMGFPASQTNTQQSVYRWECWAQQMLKPFLIDYRSIKCHTIKPLVCVHLSVSTSNQGYFEMHTFHPTTLWLYWSCAGSFPQFEGL